MDSSAVEFTDDEIQEELAKFGIHNVPEERLQEFKRDLGRLIHYERSKTSSQNTSVLSSQSDSSVSFHGTNRGIRMERIPLDDVPSQSRYTNANQPMTAYEKYGKENRSDQSPTGARKQLDVRLPSYRSHYADQGGFSLYGGHQPARSQSPPPAKELRDDVSEADSERRFVKRKVLRKDGEGSKFIDESMTESDAGSLGSLQARLRELPLRDGDGYKRPCSARSSAKEDPPYRLAPDDPRPASVILRPADNPHTQNWRKNDPVNRYQQLQQVWARYKAPGEKTHKELRWNIKSQMQYREQPEKKPQKVFVQNDYVVPTEKKRNTLRWQVRMNMAEGQMPPSNHFPDFY